MSPKNISNSKDNQNKRLVRVSLPSDLKALFSNVVNMSINKDGEVFFDFITVGPGGENDGRVVSRIVMSKSKAKNFSAVLSKFIKNK